MVIIDTVPENLQNILSSKFQFGVEVLPISRFRNPQGDVAYHFEPFLADLDSYPDPVVGGSDTNAPTQLAVVRPSMTDIDTVVVPALEDGFRRLFLGENRWHEVRIHGSMRPQIKYIAAYQVAPISAVTHLAPVKSIAPWKDSGKFVLDFAEPAHEIRRVPAK